MIADRPVYDDRGLGVGMMVATPRFVDRRRETHRPLWPFGTVPRAPSATIVDFRIHLLACALSALSVPAWAQSARPIRAQAGRQVQVPLDPARSLPRPLARLPQHAAAALYAPHLDHLLEDATDAARVLGAVEPDFADKPAPQILAELVWGARTGLARSNPERSRAIARLADPRGLRAVGIEPRSPATITFDPELGVAVVQLGLMDRPRWERFLTEIAGPARTRVEVEGEQASVIAADSDLPVTCLARQSELTCQIGAGAEDAPLAPLERITAGRGAQLGDVDGLIRAFTALPADARLFAVVNTPAMARWLGGVAKSHEDRANRFERPEVRRRAIAEAQHFGRKVEHMAAKVEGAAFGLYRDERGVRVQLESALSKFGAKLLQPHLRTIGEHDVVSRWASTPALAQFILRTHPKTTQRFLEAMDLDLPASSLTGDLALLTLGVDAECPMAKAKRDKLRDQRSWAFLLPSAAAVGLAGKQAATHTRRRLQSQLPPNDTEALPTRFRGHVHGSPYEIDVRDHVMLFGAGHGAAEAARRRLTTSPPRAARRRPPVLEASVDLLAIDAALGSGALSTEHRPELLALDALRHRLRPLLEHVARMGLTVRAADRGDRLSAQLELQP